MFTTYKMKYNSDILRQLHRELHDITREVVRVCDEAKIPYFIQGGTAIGAHFFEDIVPWDDDIDLGMTRENYERFLHEAPKLLREGYTLQEFTTEPDTPFYFAKVRKQGTKFVESEWVRYDWDTYLTEVLAGRKHDDNIFTLRVDGMGISDLPISLRKYQSFGLDELDTLYMWVHNALEGIKDDAEEDETPLYPVVFTPNESGYTVTVPDLELKAEARDLKKAFRRAKALMNSYHSYTRRCGEELAPPSEYEAMCEKYPNATVMLLALDPLPEKEETAEE